DQNASTGQIFFMGDAGVTSHSYLDVTAQGPAANVPVSYDILFGTTGVGVANSVAAHFVPTAHPGVLRETGGGNRYMIEPAAALGRPQLAAAPNTYGFTKGYRITTNLTLYGLPANL
ncbi:MAG: hypothetical protein ACRDYV_22810, partial [Acidimicrobiia bacterium]